MGRLALLLLTAFALVGCDVGEKRAALDDADAVETTTVELVRSYRFEPDVIRVEAGDTVTWRNEDEFTHDVQLEEGPDTTRHQLEPGDDVQLTFAEPGTYDYVCTLHPRDMRGRVIVT